MVEHLANRLTAGANLEAAAAGLRELVCNMGLAPYEAEYIVNDAQARDRSPELSEDYATRLRQMQADHTNRIEAIRETANLDDELREQLIESEQEKFRSQLLQQRAG